MKTALRFEEKAAADADADGEITLDELARTPIDVRTYDPSGLEAPSLGAFISSLARTVGHFRGEGECRASAARWGARRGHATPVFDLGTRSRVLSCAHRKVALKFRAQWSFP